jgi:hypothetical protein
MADVFRLHELIKISLLCHRCIVYAPCAIVLFQGVHSKHQFLSAERPFTKSEGCFQRCDTGEEEKDE